MNNPETAKLTSRPISLAGFFALIGGLAMACCQWLVFYHAPVAMYEGVIQKIFYTHLPLAWWGMLSFFTVFISSIAYLCTKTVFWDALSEAAAETGLLLSALALLSGSIWARVSWNTWWTWDPRLSTTLIMWFIYAGYMLVRKMDLSPSRRRVIAAVVGIIAFIEVPLVFFSTRLWPQTIHPRVLGAGGGGLEPEMKLTVICCVAAFGLLWLGLIIFRCKLGIQQQKIDILTVIP